MSLYRDIVIADQMPVHMFAQMYIQLIFVAVSDLSSHYINLYWIYLRYGKKQVQKDVRPSFSNPGMTMTLRSPRYAILEIKLQDVSEAPLWLRQTLNDIGAESACFSSWRCLIEVAAQRVCYLILSKFVISFLDFSGFLTLHSRPSKSTNSRSFSGPTLDVSFCVYSFQYRLFVPTNQLVAYLEPSSCWCYCNLACGPRSSKMLWGHKTQGIGCLGLCGYRHMCTDYGSSNVL